MNDTRSTPEKQSPSSQIPISLRPALAKLSHLEAHIFLILSCVCNRTGNKAGIVGISKSDLSRLMNIPRRSITRALPALFDSGLLTPHKPPEKQKSTNTWKSTAPDHGSWAIVTHYRR